MASSRSSSQTWHVQFVRFPSSAATIHAIRSGGVVARDGSCLGVTAGSGARITLSWAEASGSVAVCGAVAADVLTTGFQLVYAAVRQRLVGLQQIELLGPAVALAFGRGGGGCQSPPHPARANQLRARCHPTGPPLLLLP